MVSLQVNVIVTLSPCLYGPGGEYATAAVGWLVSYVQVKVFDTTLLFPAPSVKLSAGILNVYTPSDAGVKVTVCIGSFVASKEDNTEVVSPIGVPSLVITKSPTTSPYATLVEVKVNSRGVSFDTLSVVTLVPPLVAAVMVIVGGVISRVHVNIESDEVALSYASTIFPAATVMVYVPSSVTAVGENTAV